MTAATTGTGSPAGFQADGVVAALCSLPPDELGRRREAFDRALLDSGVVFRVTGAAAPRPYPVDLVPRVVDAGTWTDLERGVQQRARAIDLFLQDVYGEQHAVHDGVVPRSALDSCPGYLPSGRNVQPGRVRAHVVGMDLVQDENARGAWRVLEDNVRSPSGLGYALQSRRLLDRVLTDVPRPDGLLSPEGAAGVLHRALLDAGAALGGDPAVVLLSAGPDDSARFEHELLAGEMDVPLVGTADLLAGPDGVRRVDRLGRLHRVDVVYRRMDESEIDEGRSADGSPFGEGLAQALRSGRVALANGPGNGVADDKAVYALVPALVRYYLGEEPLLQDVPTYLCSDPDQRAEVVARLDELVLKPVDGYGGQGVTIGPLATDEELARLRRDLDADPARWIAQEVVALSTQPVVDPPDGATPAVGGGVSQRHVDLRVFGCVRADAVEVAPAALTRFATEGSMIVNSSRGGGAKDTWLLA